MVPVFFALLAPAESQGFGQPESERPTARQRAPLLRCVKITGKANEHGKREGRELHNQKWVIIF